MLVVGLALTGRFCLFPAKEFLMKNPQEFSLPTTPQQADTLTKHFCTHFLHEFQSSRGTDSYFRIYTAIEKTASKTGNAPEVVARALVESGLRASKESFPGSFVSAIEQRRATPHWNLAAATPQQRELLRFWGVTPEYKTSDYKRAARRYH